MLGEEDHLGCFLRRDAGLGTGIDRLLQTAGDGQPLPGDTDALKFLGAGLGFGLGDDANLFGLGFVLGGLAQSGGGVDLIHGEFDRLVGLDVIDQALQHGVAEVLHDVFEAFLDGEGDLLLFGEDVVDRHLRHQGADRVEHVGRDLPIRVHQLVMSGNDGLVILLHKELDGDEQIDEDVVLGLALDLDLQLTDAMGDAAGDLVDQRNFEVEAGVSDSVKLPESLDDGLGLLLHGEEAARQYHQEENNSDTEDDEWGHDRLPFCRQYGVLIQCSCSHRPRRG